MQRHVLVDNPGDLAPRLIATPPVPISQIGTGAHVIDDTLGVPFSITVPRRGRIHSLIYYDLDNEKTGVEVWLFNTALTSTIPADDAEFIITDVDQLKVEKVVEVSAFNEASSGAVAREEFNPPIPYEAVENKLWGLVRLLAAQTIAVQPYVSLRVEPLS